MRVILEKVPVQVRRRKYRAHPIYKAGEPGKGPGREYKMANVFAERIVRAAKLDPHLYEEVEADKSAYGQAVAVVVLSSLAAGIGSIQRAGYPGLLLGTVSALIGWFIWAYLIFLIGTKLLPEPQTSADLGQLLRTVGFSSSPGLIRILGIIPGVAIVVFILAPVWMLVAMVVAAKQALDYASIWRAVGVCAIAWLIQTFIILIIFAVFGPPAA